MAERRQIIAEIVAEDKTRAALRSARRKVRKLKDDVEALDEALTDEEKAALVAARSIKKMGDAARNAAPKIQGMKKGVESLGISGEALSSVYTLAGFAIGKLGAKLIEFASDAMAKAIESNENAARTSEMLTTSWDKFQVSILDATVGIEESSQAMNEWSKALDGASAIADKAAKDTSDYGTAWDIARGPITLAGLAIDSTKDSLIEIGDVAVATAGDVRELTAAQRELNRALDESAQFQTSARGGGGLADFGNTFANRQRMNELAEARRNRGRGRGGGRGRQDGPRALSRSFTADFEVTDDPQQRAHEARNRELETAAIRAQSDELLRRLEINSELAKQNQDAALARQEFLATNVDLSQSFQDLANNGVGAVTSAIGEMITQLVAGEFSLAGFGTQLLGQFGAMIKSIGEGMIGLGLAFSFVGKGGLAANPLAAVGIGAGLIATGAIMEGLSKRGQKAMTSGSSGGNAATAAVNDAVNAIAPRGGDRDQEPRKTTIVVGDREMRGFVVDSVNQARDLGEIPMVPAGAL